MRWGGKEENNRFWSYEKENHLDLNDKIINSNERREGDLYTPSLNSATSH